MSNYYGYQQPQQRLPQQPADGQVPNGTSSSSSFYNAGGAPYGGGAPQPQHQPQQFQQQQPYPTGIQQQQQQQQQQWQSQPQQPNPQQQQQQQQQNFWNPAAAATMMNMAGTMATSGGLSNDAMLDLASNAGKTFLQSGTARVMPGMQGFMGHLRTYFAVDNRYVKRKMQKVLFPFLSKQWSRLQSGPAPGHDMSSSMVHFALPFTDENAPDLYLPCMCLITYSLLCALCYGTAQQFSPEVLPDVTTRCMLAQILEVLAIRFGFYMMQAPIAILDLFAYTGYKYLGLSINMFVGLLLGFLHYGHSAYYMTFLVTASAQSYFMLKTMANNIPMVTAATGPKREVMVLGFAASQFATMWFVSQTKFLN